MSDLHTPAMHGTSARQNGCGEAKGGGLLVLAGCQDGGVRGYVLQEGHGAPGGQLEQCLGLAHLGGVADMCVV